MSAISLRTESETRTIFLRFVDQALQRGITSFFLDKAHVDAGVSATGDGTVCNNGRCGNVSLEKARAWSIGHRELLRQIASRPLATGPTVGNGGAAMLNRMGGAHVGGSADEAGILSLRQYQAQNSSNAIAAGFPFTTDGYAAFLMAYEQGRSFMWSYVCPPCSAFPSLPESSPGPGMHTGTNSTSSRSGLRSSSTGWVHHWGQRYWTALVKSTRVSSRTGRFRSTRRPTRDGSSGQRLVPAAPDEAERWLAEHWEMWREQGHPTI